MTGGNDASCQQEAAMDSLKLDVNKITDLIASKFVSGEYSLSVLKLQKLLYYNDDITAKFMNEQQFKGLIIKGY